MRVRDLSIEAGKRGLTRIAFEGSRAESSDGSDEGGELARRGVLQLSEYLAGIRTHFDLPIDLGSVAGLTPFRRAVLEALLRIPYGKTASYGDVAAEIGCRSARAVGQAVGWNPLPILIPCHRVIAKDGSIGGYSGGIDRKELLLSVEGIRIQH